MDLPALALLELRDLAVPRDNRVCVREVALALERHQAPDGGFNPTQIEQSDACMNGMFLAFGCYFGADARRLQSVVDFLLGQRMPDGGFNCRSNRDRGVRVGSVHTTASVIEVAAGCGVAADPGVAPPSWRTASLPQQRSTSSLATLKPQKSSPGRSASRRIRSTVLPTTTSMAGGDP